MAVPTARQPEVTHLRRGEDFKEALRDGRAVWMAGRRVEDVTADPGLGPGIDLIAEMFDDQFTDRYRDVTTCVDPATGTRLSRAWQTPRNVDDLRERRKLIEYTTLKTIGTFGRPPDLGPLIAIGLLARKPLFEGSRSSFSRSNLDLAANIDRFVDRGRTNSLVCAEVIVDPQTDRSRPVAESPGLLRVVGEEATGVRVHGAKSVGSISAQADEIIVSNLVRPGLPTEACLWASIPVATEGLKLICRPKISRPEADSFDHPIESLGEESDQLIIFDNVLIPDELLFNLGDQDLLKLYGPVMVFGAWHILSRLWTKAEIFVGIAQLVTDAIGTSQIPQVRAHVADLIQYAQALRAFVLAAEQQGTLTEGNLFAPDVALLTAGRLYSIEHYPRVIHILQELCGQGLVMRFTRADFESDEVGHYLDEMLPGHEITAKDKNRLMNFVWDLTTGDHAGRTTLFENVNAQPAPLLRERLYWEYPRERLVSLARELAGIT